jgi:hypothetical protein
MKEPQRLGSLTKNITKLVPGSNTPQTKSSNLPSSSETTVRTIQKNTNPRTEGSTTGSGQILPAKRWRDGDGQRALAAATHREAQKALMASIRQHVSCTPVYPTPEMVIARYEVTGNLEAATEILTAAMAPMEGREMLKRLVKLQTLTAARDGEVEDMKLKITAYMEKLFKYPADIVGRVLDEYPDENTFFPSWHELKKEIEFWNRDRRMMLEALQSAILQH